MLKEFKDFIMKGNVVDLAIGVIIGAAFSGIVNSLVGDIITPLLLNPTLEAAGVKDIAEWKPGGVLLGKFLSSVISFLVISFILFIVVKSMKKKEEAPAGPTASEVLLGEIRDLLKR
ncbi:MAG: large conductance mechanosensitive channel protein MscL [Pseudarcicella sp.]|jgi:large conductance mechanosensitive channel|nr:large conductance mechanosensitive channel protein MscL [Pseudarcicella sp.]MBP6411744.1 large conductance mechanosensitive channel protein MscL [Pseudarcicella sp.]